MTKPAVSLSQPEVALHLTSIDEWQKDTAETSECSSHPQILHKGQLTLLSYLADTCSRLSSTDLGLGTLMS